MKKEKGMALAIALILILIISIFALSIGTIGVSNLNNVDNFRNSSQAFYAAKSGIAKSMVQLATSSGWAPISPFTGNLSSASGNYYVTFDKTKDYYSYNNTSGASTYTYPNNTKTPGIDVPKGYVYLVSTGRSNNMISRVAVLLKGGSSGPSPFKYACFVDDSMTFAGSIQTLSTDSDQPGFPTYLNDGSLGTNSSKNGSIDFTGSTVIYGNIDCGPDGDPDKAYNQKGSAQITGEKKALEKKISMENVADPLANDSFLGNLTFSDGKMTNTDTGQEVNLPLAPGRYGNLTMTTTGGSYTDMKLKGGKYSFTSISQTTAQTKVNIKVDSPGPIDFYVSGNIDLPGSIQNDNKPIKETLQIYQTSDNCKKVNLSIVRGYFAFYTPKADISIDGACDIWGSLVSEKLNVSSRGSLRMIYNKALANIPSDGGGTNEITTWQVIN